MKLLKSRVFRIIAGFSLAVLIIAFIWVEISRNNTLNFDNRTTETEYNSFIRDEAEQVSCSYYDIFESENGGRISVLSNDGKEIVSLYCNYTKLDLGGSMEKLLMYLNRICKDDMKPQLEKLCGDIGIDYDNCTIKDIGKSGLEEIAAQIR